MRQGKMWPSPALVVAALALLVALGGTVYAAKKAKLDGRAIRVKSIPGNRVKPHSIAANRLRQSLLANLRGHDGKIIGAEIDLQSLAQVPSAAHAETATTAQSAVDAETAQNAVNAINATNVNGHTAGCLPGTEESSPAPAGRARPAKPRSAPPPRPPPAPPRTAPCQRRFSSPPSRRNRASTWTKATSGRVTSRS